MMNRRRNPVSIDVTVEERDEAVCDTTHDFAGRTGTVVDGTTVIDEWIG
jgi:hypothetical protein